MGQKSNSLYLSKNVADYLDKLWKGNDVSLDIRVTKNGRWCDQKVLPDVVTLICHIIAEEFSDKEFTHNDIQKSSRLEEHITKVFAKPSLNDEDARSEYDKFCAQSINALVAAGLLIADKTTRQHKFIVRPKALQVIQEIAKSEMCALDFLNKYISETCRQSRINEWFEDFFEKEDIDSFNQLKLQYTDFITNKTPINGEQECHRIFRVVLNVQACSRQRKGTVWGRLSKNIINLEDIRYNSTNFRDDITGKPKNIPRQRWEVPFDKSAMSSYEEKTILKKRENKVIQEVKEFHNNVPSIKDSHSSPNAPSTPAVEGHHIFPRAQYPSLQTFRENIIPLTPTQHSIAHKGGTFQVNPAYQAFCLLQKLEEIQKCEEEENCSFYSIEKFKTMLSIAKILDGDKLNQYKVDDIKIEILRYYSAS